MAKLEDIESVVDEYNRYKEPVKVDIDRFEEGELVVKISSDDDYDTKEFQIDLQNALSDGVELAKIEKVGGKTRTVTFRISRRESPLDHAIRLLGKYDEGTITRSVDVCECCGVPADQVEKKVKIKKK